VPAWGKLTMRQYDFEPSKTLLRRAKRAEQEAARKRWDDDNRKRTAARLQTTILALEREVANLEVSIDSELAFVRIDGGTSSASLASVRMMQSRRDNLVTTLTRLSENSLSIEIVDT
jgi:hypothetical protein